MSVTQFSAANIQELVVDAWSDIFMQELREQLLLGALVNKDYSGEINAMGDTVKVSQINAPTGQLLTVGTNADTFATEAISTTQVSIVADKRAVAAYEFEDTVKLMSQLGNKDSEIRKGMSFAIAKQVNDYLYTLVAPSSSSPDHDLAGTATLNAATVNAVRLLAAKAKWDKTKGWYLLADPKYYSDLLNEVTLTNSQYVPDAPVVGGQIATQRFGFNIFEDNSRGDSYALAFHPDFLHLVMKTQPNFQVSNLHSNHKFGFIISVDMIFGAALGINGNVKHIKIHNP